MTRSERLAWCLIAGILFSIIVVCLAFMLDPFQDPKPMDCPQVHREHRWA